MKRLDVLPKPGGQNDHWPTVARLYEDPDSQEPQPVDTILIGGDDRPLRASSAVVAASLTERESFRRNGSVIEEMHPTVAVVDGSAVLEDLPPESISPAVLRSLSGPLVKITLETESGSDGERLAVVIARNRVRDALMSGS